MAPSRHEYTDSEEEMDVNVDVINTHGDNDSGSGGVRVEVSPPRASVVDVPSSFRSPRASISESGPRVKLTVSCSCCFRCFHLAKMVT